MRKAAWRTLGSLGLGLVAVFLVLGMSGTTVLLGPASSARDGGTTLMADHTAAAVKPDAALTSWINTSDATGPAAFQPVPAWINFTIMYGNVTPGFELASNNTYVNLTIYDDVSLSYYLNYSFPIVTGVATYSLELDQAFLGCSAADCTASMPDTYTYTLLSTINDTANGGSLGTNTTVVSTTHWVTYLPTYVYFKGVSGPTVNSVLPAWVNFTIAYGNVEPSFVISSTYVTATLEIYDTVTHSDYMVYSVPIVSGQATYSIELDQTFLGCSAANCTATMPDTYGFSLYATLTGVGNGGVPASTSDLLFATTTWVNALSTWVNALTATGPSPYSTLPGWINFTLVYGGVGPSYEVGPANTTVYLYTLNEVTHASANYSVPLKLGQTSYSLELTSSGLAGCTQANCTTTFGSMNDTYAFSLWPSINGTAYRGIYTVNGTLFAPLAVSAFILYAPTFSVSAPAATVILGNVNITTNYTAQFLVTAEVYVYTVPTLQGVAPVLLYSASALKPTGTTGAVTNVWYEGTPGSYEVSFVAYLTYETVYINGTVTVETTPSGGVVYQNTTIYNNVTGGSTPAGFFGLGPAVSGTLFLLIGLIVGILAGLVAARMVMSSAQAKPPQQWSEKKEEETSNTCSVCGKSFGSADELAAHSKSEHGMQ